MNALPTAPVSGLPSIAHEGLYQQTKEWLSEVRFWETECVFLHKLIDRLFLQAVEGRSGDELRKLDGQLNAFTDQDLPQLLKALTLHFNQLADLSENGPGSDGKETNYREIHRQLRQLTAHGRERFRQLKERIFKHMEGIMETGFPTLGRLMIY